jgi:hypothetical protein
MKEKLTAGKYFLRGAGNSIKSADCKTTREPDFPL